MAGQIIVVQKNMTFNYSNLPAGGTYTHVHVRALNVVHARELIVNARASGGNIGTNASAVVQVRGFYPDPDDGNDVVGNVISGLSINLATGITGVPGVGTTSQVNAIPAWIRISTLFTQASGAAVALILTYSIEIVVRE